MNTFVDLVQVVATSSGAVSFVLGSAVTGFRGTEALVDGAAYTYAVQQDANWEVGNGTYIASTNSLVRVPIYSSNGNQPVAFDVNAIVGFTFGAEDLAALLAAITTGSTAVTAKAAFNAYGLQWGVWFSATPGVSELLALYVAPVAFQFNTNFAGASTAAPLIEPAASFTLNIDHQVGGAGAWVTVGTVTIGTDGGITMATVGSAPVPVAIGNRLRVVAPATVDTAVQGFAITFKGFIP